MAYGEMCARLALGGAEGSTTIERDVIKRHFSVQTVLLELSIMLSTLGSPMWAVLLTQG